jgi:hypothetical protein
MYGDDNGPRQEGDPPSAAQVKVVLESGAVAGNILFKAKKDKTLPKPGDRYFTEVLYEYDGATRDEVVRAALEAARNEIYVKNQKKYFDHAISYVPGIGDCGEGIRHKLKPGEAGLVDTLLLEKKSLKKMKPSMFSTPAEVILEVGISCVFSDNVFYGMATARKVTFVKKLNEGDFNQLNELPEEPDEDADDFFASMTEGGDEPLSSPSTAAAGATADGPTVMADGSTAIPSTVGGATVGAIAKPRSAVGPVETSAPLADANESGATQHNGDHAASQKRASENHLMQAGQYDGNGAAVEKPTAGGKQSSSKRRRK